MNRRELLEAAAVGAGAMLAGDAVAATLRGRPVSTPAASFRVTPIEGGRLVHETARDKTDEAHIKAYLSV